MLTLQELRALRERITPGRWRLEVSDRRRHGVVRSGKRNVANIWDRWTAGDRELILHAPDLLTRLIETEEELERLQKGAKLFSKHYGETMKKLAEND